METKHNSSHWVFYKEDGSKHSFGKETLTEEQALELLNNPPAPNYKELREKAYAEAGLTAEAYFLARIQADLDGDDTYIEDFKAKRLIIKGIYPKP